MNQATADALVVQHVTDDPHYILGIIWAPTTIAGYAELQAYISCFIYDYWSHLIDDDKPEEIMHRYLIQ